MQRPVWWKRWLSHLGSVSIAKAHSAYSGDLEVVYNRGRYALSTPHAVYSYEDLYTTFRQSFEQMPLAELPIQKVLVLGMGLGSIPYLLEKVFKQRYRYTLVEIDPQVIEFARLYGCLEGVLASPLEVICADAAEWVARTPTEQYDLICVDIFIDDEVPGAVETRDFLEHLSRWLAPKGYLLYNRLTYNKKLMDKTMGFYEKNFKFVYIEATHIPLNGNWMLINRPV